jgi:hypothetical protein
MVSRKYVYTGGDKRGKVPQSLIDKTSSLVIWECFVYERSEGVGWSPYCFYLQTHRTKPVDDWTFEFCPSGSIRTGKRVSWALMKSRSSSVEQSRA